MAGVLLLCPHQESNLDRKLRKLAFYPLNYEGNSFRLTVSDTKRKSRPPIFILLINDIELC